MPPKHKTNVTKSKAKATKDKTSKTRKPRQKAKAKESGTKRGATSTTRKRVMKGATRKPSTSASIAGRRNGQSMNLATVESMESNVPPIGVSVGMSVDDPETTITPVDQTVGSQNNGRPQTTQGDYATETQPSSEVRNDQADLVRSLTRSISEAFNAQREKQGSRQQVSNEGLPESQDQVGHTANRSMPHLVARPSVESTSGLTDLSLVLNQALLAHGSILSQLDKSESVIGQLQRRISQASVTSRPGSDIGRRSMSVNPPVSVANGSQIAGATQNGGNAPVQDITPLAPSRPSSTSSLLAGREVSRERGRKRSRERSTHRRKRGGGSSVSSSDGSSRRNRRRKSQKRRDDSDSDSSPHRDKRARRSRSSKSFSSNSSIYHLVDSEHDSEDSDSSSDEEYDGDVGARTPRGSRLLPAFNGKNEKWTIWHARFEAVAANHGWSKAKKLSALTTLLRGDAGEYVFGTVKEKVRRNYKALVKTLDRQYRVIESKRSYRREWAELRQTHGQSVEELAARIKVLYNKAFPDRDYKTRREDVVAKFFDALTDTTLKAQVQFVKDPQNIDQAVREVIHYRDTCYKKKNSSCKN